MSGQNIKNVVANVPNVKSNKQQMTNNNQDIQLQNDTAYISTQTRTGITNYSSDVNVINGTDDKDTLNGTDKADKINGGKGDDQLYGNDGNDLLIGGDDSDGLEGGAGNDILQGGKGKDTLKGNQGNDQLYGDNGEDYLNGGDGDDILNGGDGNDELQGGKGKDTLDGGLGDDTLNGGDGDDVYYIDSKGDTIIDSGGNDTASINVSGVKVPNDIEKIIYTDDANELPYFINALSYYTESPFAKNTVKYYFSDGTDNPLNNPQAYSPSQQQAVKAVLDAWQQHADINFQQVTSKEQATLIFYRDSSPLEKGMYGYAVLGGNSVHIDISQDIDYKEGILPSLLVHEIGHFLGLSHPRTYADNNENANPSVQVPISEDSSNFTQMSYTKDPSSTHKGPQLFDIATMQYIYGINNNINKGNDNYSLQDKYIGDAHGIDSIDASKQNKDTHISLMEGSWNYSGEKAELISADNQSFIGYGTWIENATTGKGNDTLFGNHLDNVLNGGAGNDIIKGKEGKDTLNGGKGNDILEGGEYDDEYIFTKGDGNDTIIDRHDDNILIFNDVSSEELTKEYTNDGLIIHYSDKDSVLLSGLQADEEPMFLTIHTTSDNQKIRLNDITEHNLISGTDESELLSGTNNNDKLYGKRGDDVLEGYGGNDEYIFAWHDGNDIIKNWNGEGQLTFNDIFSNKLSKEYTHDGLLIRYSDEDSVLLEGMKKTDPINFTIKTLDKTISLDEIAEYDGINFISGTNNNDNLTGTNSKDHIEGKDGNDILYGRGGDDELYGGDGKDEYIFAQGDGNDIITYGDNNSILTFKDISLEEISKEYTDDGLLIHYSNEDSVLLEWITEGQFIEFTIKTTADNQSTNLNDIPKKDAILGTKNDDKLTGTDTNDEIYGKDGKDILHGNAGRDKLEGGDGDDKLYGGDGNDRLNGGNGNDKLDGGDGDDLLLGHHGDDTLNGGDGADWFVGYDGNDTLIGGYDNDIYEFHKGNDHDIIIDTQGESILQFYSIYQNDITKEYTDKGLLLRYSDKDSVLLADVEQGKTNNFTIQVNYQDINLDDIADYKDDTTTGETITGQDNADDSLYGKDGDDTITGAGGNDKLYGNEGDDTINGGEGNDYLFAGEGNDTLNGGEGNDYLIARLGDNSLDGGDGNDFLYAGKGTDILNGMQGSDRLYGNGGDDTLNGGADNDYLYGGDGADSLNGGADNDRLYASNGKDTLNGGEGDDYLSGGNGNDMLNGGLGSDQLHGGNGADTFVFDSTLSESNSNNIIDFVSLTDVLQLDNQIFSELSEGTLKNSQFDINTTGMAENSDTRIIYNSDNGELSYDADGNGAEQAQIFAILESLPTLQATDIVVI